MPRKNSTKKHTAKSEAISPVEQKVAADTSKSNLVYAGFIVRFAALFVDILAVIVVNIALAVTVVLAWLSWATFWVYSVVMLVNMNGATVGKKLFGIKVVVREGQIGYGKAILREVVGKIVSSLVLNLGFLWVIWDKEKQGWHDKIADTHVVHVVPFAGGRKVAAWVISLFLMVLIIGSPLLILIGVVPLISYLSKNPATVNQQIEQLKELQNNSTQLQNSLEELKQMQLQLESSMEATPSGY